MEQIYNRNKTFGKEKCFTVLEELIQTRDRKIKRFVKKNLQLYQNELAFYRKYSTDRSTTKLCLTLARERKNHYLLLSDNALNDIEVENFFRNCIVASYRKFLKNSQ